MPQTRSLSWLVVELARYFQAELGSLGKLYVDGGVMGALCFCYGSETVDKGTKPSSVVVLTISYTVFSRLLLPVEALLPLVKHACQKGAHILGWGQRLGAPVYCSECAWSRFNAFDTPVATYYQCQSQSKLFASNFPQGHPILLIKETTMCMNLLTSSIHFPRAYPDNHAMSNIQQVIR